MSKAVITFGRLNPPTVGHQKLVDKVKSEAKKRGAMPHVYLSHSQDAKKNPLDYDTKVRIAKKVFGPSITKSKARNIIEVLKELEKMGHTEVTIVVGSDRVKEFDTLTSKYNGKEYNFNKIGVVSAGDRDPDAEGVSGMSASKMRAAAQAGDYDLFKKGTPTAMSEKDKKFMYDKIRSEMGISEEKELEVTDDDFEFTDAELERFIDAIDIDSLDEEGELDEEFEEFLEEVLLERKPLTVQQRMAIGRRMKRLQPRIKRRREMLKKRMATPAKLETRARKAAIKLLRKRFAGKQGQNYASLSPSSKISVDRIIQKKLAMVGKISKRLLPKIRKAEQERLKKARSAENESVDINATFESYFSEATAKDPVIFNIEEEYIFEEEDDQTNVKLMNILRQAFRDPTERQLVIRSLKGGEKTLSNPKLRPFILKLLNRLLDAAQQDPAIYNKMRDKLRRMGQDDEVKEAQDPDIKDRPGSQPAGYHKGLKKSTKVSRDRHFKKYADKSDSDPSNYKPAPGDKGAKTKPSVHTQKYKAMYGEDLDAAFEKFISEEYIEEKALEGLKKKAEKSGIPYSILKKVYDRGMAAWKSGHRPGTTPQQWAYARVNSFITGGKTRTTADADLWKQARGQKEQVEEGKYTPDANYPKDSMKIGKKHYIIYKDRRDWWAHEVDKDGSQVGDGIFDPSKRELIKMLMKEEVEEARKSPLQHLKDFDEITLAKLRGKVKKGVMSRSKRDELIQKVKEKGLAAVANMYGISARELQAITESFALDEKVNQSQIDQLEKFADRILAKYDIDVEFTRHFVDRLNDPRNNPEIKVAELQKFFKKIQKNKGKDIKSNPDTQVVLKDLTTSLNLPVVINYKDGKFEVVNKTIMRKKDFKTPDKTIQYENAVAAAREKIKREKEADKVKHDAMLDRARLRDTQAKNRAESVDAQFENFILQQHPNCGTSECCGQCDTVSITEGFIAGIPDTMYAKDFEEHKVHGGFALHPSVMEQGGAGEEGTKKLVQKYKKGTPGEVCEAIEFMEKNEILFSENIYRPLSEKYFEFFREARQLMNEGAIEVTGTNRQILETDIGEFDIYEGEEVPLDCPLVEEDEKTPELNKPKRGGPKKFYVYVRDPSSGNVKKVTFGDTTGLKVKINNPAARKSFAARHQCDTRNDKTTASYWACRLPRYAASLGMQVDNPGAFW